MTSSPISLSSVMKPRPREDDRDAFSGEDKSGFSPASVVVPTGYQREQRLRFRTRCVCPRQSAQDRSVTKALRRAERATQIQSIPVRDVDVDLLYQSGGATTQQAAARQTRGCKGRVAPSLRSASPNFYSKAIALLVASERVGQAEALSVPGPTGIGSATIKQNGIGGTAVGLMTKGTRSASISL